MNQATLANVVQIEGVGIHTGGHCRLSLRPTGANRGRVFLTPDGVEIPARVDHVVNCDRSTILGKGEARVHTPEHLLSALAALAIDNVEILIEGPEVPILDGSALPFIDALEKAGRSELNVPARYLELEQPVSVGTVGGSLVLAFPEPTTRFEYVLHYPHPMLGCQTAHYVPGETDYRAEIAPARTFALWEEVKPLLDRGMALGGTLENALVVYQDRYSSDLKVPDEPVRHKLLDLIGDFALLDARFRGRVLAIKAGHRLHVECAKTVWEALVSNSTL